MEVLLFFSMKLLVMVLVHGQETGITLPADGEWIDIGSQAVYYIEKHKKLSWFKARQDCASKVIGGRLAKFETKNEMLLLRNYLKDVPEYLWIGLHYVDKGPFVWADNSTPAFTNWERGEPLSILSRECVELNAETLAWKVGSTCNWATLYICAADKESVELIETGHETAYYIERRLKITWTDASQICSSWEHRGRRGLLANFETKDQLRFLHSHLKDIPGYLWIGLHKYRKDSGSFAWTDNSPPAFTNWDEGEPNNRYLTECVGLNAATLAWNDQPCNSENPFICGFYKSVRPNVKANPSHSPSLLSRTGSPSGGHVAGIAVGVVIGLLILSTLVFFLVKRWKTNNTLSSWIQNRVFWRREDHFERLSKEDITNEL